MRSPFARARNKRIIIATFASNIYRVQQIIDLAVEDGRKVAFSGRKMVNNTAMAQELGYMHIPEGTLISVDELNQYPPEQVVLVTTGSQGEPLSALEPYGLLQPPSGACGPRRLHHHLRQPHPLRTKKA